jgi:hypothetical protein
MVLVVKLLQKCLLAVEFTVPNVLSIRGCRKSFMNSCCPRFYLDFDLEDFNVTSLPDLPEMRDFRAHPGVGSNGCASSAERSDYARP